MIHVHISQSDAPAPLSSFLATGIVAQPGGQSNATPLKARNNIVKNCVPGAAVILQLLPWVPEMKVFNRCGTDQALGVFPEVGQQVEGNAVNASVTIADGDDAIFTFDGLQTWLVS